MAYNSYYPATYPYYAYQAQNTPNFNDFQQGQGNIQNSQNRANTGILWVQGEAGAKAYPVAPNNTVQLWDSESQTIYLKSADASGMPSMKILDYTIREEGRRNDILKQVDLSGYVTREEFERRFAELRRVNDESVVQAV